MTESTITKIDSDRAGYQNIGLFIGPAIFLVMLALVIFNKPCPLKLGERLRWVYGWQFGGPQRRFLFQ